MCFSPLLALLASWRALSHSPRLQIWHQFLPHGVFEDLALLLITLLCSLSISTPNFLCTQQGG